jgi:superfamily II DNA helicase RecQ
MAMYWRKRAWGRKCSVHTYETIGTMAMTVGEAMRALNILSFRGRQREAVEAVLSGSDVLYVFPTGCGKSVVYQVAALCSEGVTLIVSPLLGLLHEQVEKVACLGIPVIAACGGTLDGLHEAVEARIVYTTPEQVHAKSALCKYLEKHDKQVVRIVVDEAHVIEEWEQFRCDSVHRDVK